ncbi:hypothetical protein ACWC4D_41570 [Streptomyces sp. NPDC001288]
MTVEQRLMDRLHEQALAENEERDWHRTGRIRCDDCGTSVRTRTLESLPEHRCSQRQRARRERSTPAQWRAKRPRSTATARPPTPDSNSAPHALGDGSRPMDDHTAELNEIAARWEHGHAELTEGCALCHGEWAEVYQLIHEQQ